MSKILTDESGKKYELVNNLVSIDKQAVLIVKELPHPPAKEKYVLQMFRNSNLDDLIVQDLDLTPDAAEKVAKAIEALLTYVRTENKYLSNGELISNYTEDMIQARKAYQDGSAA